jgi:hypothetical protein
LIDGNAQNLMVGEIESGGMDAEVRASVNWRRISAGVELSGVLNWMYVGGMIPRRQWIGRNVGGLACGRM